VFEATIDRMDRWACGVERLAILFDENKVPPDAPTVSVIAFRSSTPSMVISEMVKSENGNVFEKLEKFVKEEPVISKDDLTCEAMRLCQTLRNRGFHVHYHELGNVTKQLAKANSINSRVAIIVAPDELAQGNVCVKNMQTGQQELVSIGVEILSKRVNEMLK
jgi:histidyl-tRNA synthetase